MGHHGFQLMMNSQNFSVADRRFCTSKIASPHPFQTHQFPQDGAASRTLKPPYSRNQPANCKTNIHPSITSTSLRCRSRSSRNLCTAGGALVGFVSPDENNRLLFHKNYRSSNKNPCAAGAVVGCLFPENPDEKLINEDLRPTSEQERSFTGWEMASLWIGLVVGVPAYYLAGSLVETGMAWWQGILTVFAGNLVLLFPLVLTGHPGTKYGISFPVLCRASFGIKGAHLPAMLRALVACGWFGIETWFGGQALFVLLNSLFNGRITGPLVPWLGTSGPEFLCFMAFWVIQGLIIWDGMESVKKLEKYCAPVLIAFSLVLLLWAYVNARGFGSMLSRTSQFGHGGALEGKFWSVFFPSLTANIGFWAPVALNIPDFTRYARCQADQIVGQLGLPIFMGAFSLLGLAVTSSTEVIFGHMISNPIEVLGKIGGVLPVTLSIIGISIATLTTNIAANVVAPANTLVNVNPSLFTFRRASLLTALLGIIFQPWKLLQSSESFAHKWLVGYSALLGPIGGIIIVDYFIIRRCNLSINDMYSSNPDGKYWYCGGYNISAMTSLLLGMMPLIPGFLQALGVIHLQGTLFLTLYYNSWFVSFFVAGLMYWILSKLGNGGT